MDLGREQRCIAVGPRLYPAPAGPRSCERPIHISHSGACSRRGQGLGRRRAASPLSSFCATPTGCSRHQLAALEMQPHPFAPVPPIRRESSPSEEIQAGAVPDGEWTTLSPSHGRHFNSDPPFLNLRPALAFSALQECLPLAIFVPTPRLVSSRASVGWSLTWLSRGIILNEGRGMLWISGPGAARLAAERRS